MKYLLACFGDSFGRERNDAILSLKTFLSVGRYVCQLVRHRPYYSNLCEAVNTVNISYDFFFQQIFFAQLRASALDLYHETNLFHLCRPKRSPSRSTHLSAIDHAMVTSNSTRPRGVWPSRAHLNWHTTSHSIETELRVPQNSLVAQHTQA